MEPFNRLMAQARVFWASMSGLRRLMVVGAVVLVIAAAGAYTYLNQSGEHVPLYTEPMSNDEAAGVVAKLKAQSLPYSLDALGTVKVPSERLAEIRVQLAGEGIPVRGGEGFELFAKSDLTATPFTQTVNYQRALQSELGRSIVQIHGLAAARVLVARPDPTPFAIPREQSAPTASVVVKPKPNTTIGKATADSIVSLVSRAVVGLKPENVIVVDSSTGRLVSDVNAKDRENLPSGQLEYMIELEKYLSNKAQEMLARHLGPGRVAVQVKADVNFQKVKERQERYSPDEKVVAAERLINSSNTGGRAGGIAGTGSNVRQAGGGGGGGAGSKEETTQTDYLVSKYVREMEDRIGAVTRLTVSALVDLTPRPAAEGETAPPLISVADAQKLIETAVGFTTGRDTITVTNAKLSGPVLPVAEPDEEEARIRRFAAYVALARNVILALAVVSGLSLVPLLLLRRRAKPVSPPAAAPAGTPPPPPTATPEQQRQQLLERYIELARSDPDRTAAVFGLLAGTPAG
jgi:flagellar M-ring protein FliF